MVLEGLELEAAVDAVEWEAVQLHFARSRHLEASLVEYGVSVLI